MEILFFDELESTQIYLTKAIREGRIKKESALITLNQTNGVGSRSNSWIGKEGNFFASFAIEESRLPKDLAIASASIYFAWLMRDILVEFDKDVWIKWPNDIYKNRNKVGGVITNRLKGFVVVGIGINLKSSDLFEALFIELSAMELFKRYIKALKRLPSWSAIFESYQLEFEKSRDFSVHIDSQLKSLRGAKLLSDGSLEIDKKRIWGLR